MGITSAEEQCKGQMHGGMELFDLPVSNWYFEEGGVSIGGGDDPGSTQLAVT